MERSGEKLKRKNIYVDVEKLKELREILNADKMPTQIARL